MDENSIGKEIVDAAIAIHRELDPWLLETIYPNERFLGDLGGLAREKPGFESTSHFSGRSTAAEFGVSPQDADVETRNLQVDKAGYGNKTNG